MLKPSIKLMASLNRICAASSDPRFPPFFTGDDLRDILMESGQGWANRAIAELVQEGYIKPAVGATNTYVVTKDGADFAGPR